MEFFFVTYEWTLTTCKFWVMKWRKCQRFWALLKFTDKQLVYDGVISKIMWMRSLQWDANDWWMGDVIWEDAMNEWTTMTRRLLNEQLSSQMRLISPFIRWREKLHLKTPSSSFNEKNLNWYKSWWLFILFYFYECNWPR